MEHYQIKNGDKVNFKAGEHTKVGVVVSYNPGGRGIFTVGVTGEHHPHYLYAEELVPVVKPSLKDRLKKAENAIIEAASDHPLTTKGPYVLVDRHATAFMNIMHKALLELTAED